MTRSVPSVREMTASPPVLTSPHDARPRFGVSIAALAALALLAVPRVVLHDLRLITEGDLATWLLVFVPFGIWVWLAGTRARRPFWMLVVIGAFHGVLLALTHQITWLLAGSELSGTDRLVNFPVSLAVGVAWGVVLGGVAVVVARLVNRAAPDQRST